MTTTRFLAVPPQPHGPLAQPAGAALRLCPPPAARPPSAPAAIARAVDIERHAAWLARCATVRAAAVARGPEGRGDVVLIDMLVSADAEAWEARTRTGREA